MYGKYPGDKFGSPLVSGFIDDEIVLLNDRIVDIPHHLALLGSQDEGLISHPRLTPRVKCPPTGIKKYRRVGQTQVLEDQL